VYGLLQHIYEGRLREFFFALLKLCEDSQLIMRGLRNLRNDESSSGG